MLIIDCSPHFRAKLDREQFVAEQRMSLMRDTGLEDGKRVFQLAYALAHLGDLPMQLLRVREDEPSVSFNEINTTLESKCKDQFASTMVSGALRPSPLRKLHLGYS